MNKQHEAQDPNTPHHRLRELAQDPAYQMALLSNPNAPTELVALLRRQIAGHTDNKIDDTTLELLAKEASEQTDPERLVWLSQYGGDISRAVARNPHTPREHLKELATSGDLLVRLELVRNPSITSELLSSLMSHRLLQRAIAASSNVKPETLFGLLGERNDKIVQSVAQNPNLPLYGMIMLWLSRRNWAVRLYESSASQDSRAKEIAPWVGRLKNLARPNAWGFPSVVAELQKGEGCHPMLRETLLQVSQYSAFYTTENDFKKLLAGDSSTIPLQMTQSYYTTVEYLSSQVTNEDPQVRKQVAANYRTRPEDLARLASDGDLSVRRAVAANYRITGDALRILARDADDSIRAKVAEHPQTPAEALEALGKDPDRTIRFEVAKNRNTAKEALLALVKEDDEGIQLAVLSHLNFPKESQDALLFAKSERVRVKLAARALKEDTRLALCRDKARAVRLALLLNSLLGCDELALLLEDEDASARARVASHPAMSAALLSRLVRDSDVEVRRTVASKFRASVDDLARLAKDRSKNVRYAVAKNKKARKTTLQRLSLDTDGRVRAAAKESLVVRLRRDEAV